MASCLCFDTAVSICMDIDVHYISCKCLDVARIFAWILQRVSAWILQAVYACLLQADIAGVYAWILQAFFLCLGYCKQSLLDYCNLFVHNNCKQSLHRDWRRSFADIASLRKLWMGKKFKFFLDKSIWNAPFSKYSPCENIMYTNWSNANNFTNPISCIYLSGSNPLKLCPPTPQTQTHAAFRIKFYPNLNMKYFLNLAWSCKWQQSNIPSHMC
jgi:hypothetical protein